MDKFKMFHKWFWVGLVVATLGGVGGLVFSLALIAEPEHRKEGAVITIWAVICLTVIIIWSLR